MATLAKIGVGTLLKRATVTIAEITNIDGPEETANLIDATHMESTGGYAEYIYGILDGGEVSCTGHLLLSSTQTNLRLELVNKTSAAYEIVFPVSGGNKTVSFTGLVTRFKMTSPVSDKMTFEATIKATGVITIT